MKVDSGYMSGKYVQKYFDDSDIGFNPLHPEQEQIQVIYSKFILFLSENIRILLFIII